MGNREAVQQRFEQALETFVARTKQDRNILAVILCGSLSYDQVWEKSDIDLLLITREQTNAALSKEGEGGRALVESGVNIHTNLIPRSAFKQLVDGALRSSFMHSLFSKSRLVYTQDQTIPELYQAIERFGSRDRQLQLFRAGNALVATLAKAEKWFHVRGDFAYSVLWILYCVTELARIETTLHGQIASREVIQQALELNPELFERVYTDLILKRVTKKAVGTALELIDSYLEVKVEQLFQPLLDYLSKAAAVRSATEIETHFHNQMNIHGVVSSCEWLADKNILLKVSSPIRLTVKSKVSFEELAFLYEH